MPTCPTCFETYPPEVSVCSADGSALVPDETYAHVDRDVAIGTNVGEYRIEAKLGQGGFGAVYRAVHPLIGKMAAVKVLSRQFSANPQMVSRFVAEARAVNQIRHRHIIDIFSFGQLPDGRQYYIMELLEGTTFDAYLAKKGRLTFAEALPILRGIARALDAAHAKNILHRDLKPENVFLVFDEDGRVEPKLLDFGLVKLMADTSHHKTKTGTPMGTPYYMSPEQCRGLDVDGRTDVYSFGALVFEVLTGKVPFDGGTAMDILVKHMTAPPPRASERCPEVPAMLDAPLAQLLAKEPADRPARVGEALDLLARAMNLDVAPSATISSSPEVLPNATDSGRAMASTMIADPPKIEPPPPVLASASARPAVGQTFLGAETDVTPPRRSRSYVLVAGVVLGLAALVGVGALVATRERGAQNEPSVTARAPAAETASAPPASAPVASSAPPPPEARDVVEVKVEGAPEGAILSANGVELGKAPGPFELKANVPVKLTLSAKGYKTRELSITPTENVLLPVSMEKAAGAALAPKGRPASPKGAGTIHSDLEGFDTSK